MRVDRNLDYEVPIHADAFETPFFRQQPQSKRAISLSEALDKTYHFPTFYTETTLAAAFFLCSYRNIIWIDFFIWDSVSKLLFILSTGSHLVFCPVRELVEGLL